MASNPQEIDLDAVIQAAVDAANKMCNPDTRRFEYDWLDDENLVVNVRPANGGTFGTLNDVQDANGYCSDIGDVIENILNTYSDCEWVKHSERWYWDEDGNEIEDEVETNEDARKIAAVQHQFYKVDRKER